MSNEKGFIAYCNVFLMILLIIALSKVKVTGTVKGILNIANYLKMVDYVAMENYRNIGLFNFGVKNTSIIDQSEVGERSIATFFKETNKNPRTFTFTIQPYPGYPNGNYYFQTKFQFHNGYLTIFSEDADLI